jgi:hypothetical protein
MSMIQDQNKKRNFISRNKLIVIGALLIWAATILLTLELKTLLTPGNFPVGTDPSADLVAVAFCVEVAVLGALLLWGGVLEREKRMEIKFARFLNTATILTAAFLCITFISVAVLFAANKAFAAGYQPILRDEPAPDYSVPAFSTPLPSQPTPTYNPTSAFLAGPIKSALDSLRVGDIWISLTPNMDSINFIQVYMNRIQCNVQDGAPAGIFAVDKSEQLVNGPIPIQDDRTFFAAQDMAVFHGIIGTLDQGYGSVYLRYTDPVTNRTCDLGSFDWTATLTQSH